ncbi:MAG: glycosyltransferase family 4 protein [Chloroflexi bacterium]|nr:glycosyltransferase family 4 protein [Chloroflexota bacterium]
MRLGLVIYGSLNTLSGGYLYDRKLVEYLRGQGDTVEVISLPWRNYAAHLADNLHFRLPRDLDLIIQDELNHPSLLSANARPRHYPVISLVHHLRCSELRPKRLNDFYRLVEKRYLNFVDGFIFNSQTTKNAVHQLLGKDKPGIVAYPPTDRFGDAISESEIIERAKSDELRILFLGNVIYRKGLHTLLEAVKSPKSNVRVDVVGSLAAEPKYARNMQEFVAVNGLSSVVKFHGSLDKEPLIEELKSAHVLVVPSSYEGFGIVYLEGMAFGLPAIGTTAGAAGEIISDGVDGFLIEPGDSGLLAGRLRVLKEKREILVRMSLAARERYLHQPRWGQMAGDVRKFLLSLLSQ